MKILKYGSIIIMSAILIYVGYMVMTLTISNNSGPKNVEYVMELAEFNHYQLNESFDLKKVGDMLISDLKRDESKESSWIVNTNLTLEELKEFDNYYNFKVAKDNVLITSAGSGVDSNGDLKVNVFKEGIEFNQLCILDNKKLNTLAVINLQ